MAGLFDSAPNLSTLNLTPEELKALELYRAQQQTAAGTAALEGDYIPKEGSVSPRNGVATQSAPIEGEYTRAGVQTRTGVDGLRGQYMPPEQPVSQAARTAGLLNADPISTQSGSFTGDYQGKPGAVETTRPGITADPVSAQEQSRVGPRGAGRTFYANTAGDVGTSVPKGSGTSGIYDTVEQAAKQGGKSLLGKAAGLLASAPVMGAQLMLTPGELGNGELSPEQRMAQLGPEEAASAVQYGKDLSDRTVAAGLGQGNQPVSLMNPNGGEPPIPSQTANPEAQTIVNDNTQAPVNETPVGPVTNAQPTTVKQAQAATAQQQETHRQTLEQGALKGLSTGAVSRPDFAKAIVEADNNRAGTQMTPEQTKKAVTQELTNMKSMNNSDLSKYISYALMAGGLLATVLDKSGNAAQSFNASFNAQLDRNLKAGLMAQKQRAEQAKLDQQMQIQQGNWKRDDRGLEIKEKDSGVNEKYKTGLLAQGDERNDITREGNQAANKLGYYREDQANARSNSRLALAKDKMIQDQSNADRQYQLNVGAAGRDEQRVTQGASNAAANMLSAKTRAAAAAAKASKEGGVTIDSKLADKVVREVESNQKIDLGATRSAVTAAVMAKAKNDPRFQTDPSGVVLEVLSQGGYTKGAPSTGLFGWGGGVTPIKQRKQ